MAAVLLHDTSNIVQRLARLNTLQARLAYTLVSQYRSTCIRYIYTPAVCALADRNDPALALQTTGLLVLGRSQSPVPSSSTSRDSLLLQYKQMVRSMYGEVPPLILLLLKSYGMDLTEDTSL